MGMYEVRLRDCQTHFCGKVSRSKVKIREIAMCQRLERKQSSSSDLMENFWDLDY